MFMNSTPGVGIKKKKKKKKKQRKKCMRENAVAIQTKLICSSLFFIFLGNPRRIS